MSPHPLPSIQPEPARAGCLYRGDLSRQAPRAHGLDRGQPVNVFSCGFHGDCTESRVADGVACCAVCEQYQPADAAPDAVPSPRNSVTAMVEALRQPPRDWPKDWSFWGTTLEAHRRLAAEYAASIPPYPADRYRGRGIVIPGGGPFFPGVYVTVRMLRHFGCDLPIEVWHHGSNEPVVRHWLEPFGVRFVDTDRHMDSTAEPPRLRGGWASKLYVLLHCSFEEVLFLDSDCYPVGDVTALFDHNTTGSILWPNPSFGDGSIHWFVYPTEPSGQPPVNGGTILLDKARCWKTLVLTQWWNDHADYVYSHGLGDQDVVRGVWQQQRQPFSRFADAPARHDRFQVDLGPEGPLFVHRFNDKFRLPCLPIRSSARSSTPLYRTESFPGEAEYDSTLPQEAVAFQSFRQFLWLLDHDPMRYRPETWDQRIWEETALSNAYQLPETLPSGSRVIDIGAHIGSFSHLALRRGAAQVWAYEVDADNFAQCATNLVLWGSRVILRSQAVWSQSGRAGYRPPPKDFNVIGQVTPDGDDVETIAIDAVLDEVSEGGAHPIHLLKLDCEAAEWPILFSARHLRRCENLVGEYHCGDWQGKDRGPDDLYRLLSSQGFTVRTLPFTDRLGLFWAIRIDSDPNTC